MSELSLKYGTPRLKEVSNIYELLSSAKFSSKSGDLMKVH